MNQGRPENLHCVAYQQELGGERACGFRSTEGQVDVLKARIRCLLRQGDITKVMQLKLYRSESLQFNTFCSKNNTDLVGF